MNKQRFMTTVDKQNVELNIWRRNLLLLLCFLLNFSKKLEKKKKKNEQTKVYDHGVQATRGQKLRGHFFCGYWKFPKSYCKFTATKIFAVTH